MNKDTYLDVLTETSRNLEKIKIIDNQLINSDINDKVKSLVKYSLSILETEIKRISQLIVITQNSQWVQE